MGDICRWLVEPRTTISTFHGNEFQQFLGGPRRDDANGILNKLRRAGTLQLYGLPAIK
jgi:hypothetical protein